MTLKEPCLIKVQFLSAEKKVIWKLRNLKNIVLSGLGNSKKFFPKDKWFIYGAIRN